MQPSAHIALTRNGRLFVTPGANATLRSLERALRVAAIPIEIDAVTTGALIDASAFESISAALSQWSLSASSAAAATVEAMRARQKWHSAALQVCRTALGSPAIARAWLEDYDRISSLDAHQVTAVAIASHPDVKGLCIFDEQGLGKTVEALFTFDRLRQQGHVDRALVFAPKNMILEWVHDLNRFFADKYRAVAIVGTEFEKRRLLDEPGDLFVTNFETAVQLEIRLRQLLQADRGQTILVIDESFFVKNASANRAVALRQLRRHAARCLVLCGTPAPNSALDLIEQFNIADDGTAFSGFKLSKDPGTAQSEVASVIEKRGVYIRRLKGAVLPELPERTFSRVLLPMSPQQQDLYDRSVSGLVSDVRATNESQFRKNLVSFMARRAALLQICSNPIAVDGAYRDELPAKVAALDSILSRLIEMEGEKVVLWSFFTASLNALHNRYAHFNPVRIDGSVGAVADRREAVRRFQEDTTTMLFIGNPAAAGAGITLHRARYAIYESMSNQPAHYLQSLDRIHRRGQKRPVEYIVLLCDQTIETVEYDRLLSKEARAQELLQDEVLEPITRHAFLKDLLAARPHWPASG